MANVRELSKRSSGASARASARPFLSIVAPCYNEAPVLREFHRRMSAACEATGKTYEIVLVNDGSRDATAEIIAELVTGGRTIGVNLLRNFGHQAAVTAGLSICRGERVLLIDSDLQDPPELLADMVRVMDGGADVVYGRRIRRDGETVFKRATASLFYRLLAWSSPTPIPVDTGDFRLMRRPVVDGLLAMPEQQRFIRGMVSWIGGRQVPLDYERRPRAAGESKYPFIAMVRFATDAVTSFSIRPLRIATFMALMSGLLSVALVAYSLLQWFDRGTVPGWTSLIAAVSFFSSIQFFLLGIIGEYVGRLFVEVKRRPLFMVDHIVTEAGPVQLPMNFSTLPEQARVSVLARLNDQSQDDGGVKHAPPVAPET